MDEFLASLRACLGAAGVLTDPSAMEPYLRDWQGKFAGCALAIARPRSTQEVAAVVQLCSAHGIRVVPQGGNTGLAGGATPDRSDTNLVLSLERCNRIVEVSPDDQVLVVEAGCILSVAQQAAREAGLMLPLSFAAEGTAQIGGALATNAGGINVLRYGTARALVLGLEVVLGDGTVLNLSSRLRKDNAGYDLKQLFIGSEGTLGVITKATLRLVPAMAQKQTAVAQLASLEAVVPFFSFMNARLAEFVSSFELMSPMATRLAVDHLPDASWPFEGAWTVLVETGSACAYLDLTDLLEQALADAFERALITDAVIAQNETQSAGFWRVRESVTEGERAAGRGLKHDVSVPISRIPEFITTCQDKVPRDFPGAMFNAFGHVGDGNIHANVVLPTSSSADRGHDRAINDLIHGLATELGGSITAEHGVGQYRAADLARYAVPEKLALMRRIRSAVDPSHVLNPGKVF